MTNTPHELEPAWHSQTNKAIAIFGQPAVPNNIGIHAFIWRNPASGSGTTSSGLATEIITSGMSASSGFAAKSITWIPAQGTATIPAGSSVFATRS